MNKGKYHLTTMMDHQLDGRRMIKIFLISIAFIPIVFISAIVLSQMHTIQIEGKGDTGHERSIHHPFICRTGSLTNRGTLYYCDYRTYFDHLLVSPRYVMFSYEGYPIYCAVGIYLGLVILTTGVLSVLPYLRK